MTIGVEFYNRDFSEYIGRHWDSIEVNRYSQSAIGGPLQASFDVYGSEEDIWKFIEMLRCPVNLIDQDRGETVWWGYISKVDVYSITGVKYGVSLDSMSNRLAVAYTYNFERETTGWATDTDSIAEYGTKEILLSTNDKTAEQALQFRNVELEVRKYPSRLPIQFASKRDTAMARIECKGWIATLAWLYYANDAGKIASENSGSRTSLFGFCEPDDWVAIGFMSHAITNWFVTSIAVKVGKIGDPADDINFYLYSSTDNDFSSFTTRPNAQLATCPGIAGSEINSYADWVELDLVSTYEIVPETLYWIVLKRTDLDYPENRTNHYYVIGEETFVFDPVTETADSYNFRRYQDGYGGGLDWFPPNYSLDANFRVLGQVETTVQIESIISRGEFFTDSEILQTTGVYSYPYRNGDSIALYELEQLLNVGTADGTRLIAKVTENRVFQVYEEPPAGSDDYFINKDGLITDQYDNEIHLASCPVAYWVQLKDIVPVSVDVSKISNASRLFVEQSEYDAQTGVYKIKQARDSDIITDALAEFMSPGINRRWQYEQG